MNPALIGLAIVCCCGALAQGQTTAALSRITIHPAERFQIVNGFGLNFTAPYFRDDQKQMFDMFIDDLGVTMFRVVPYLVYSDWEVVNDNDDPNVMNWEYYNDRYSTPIFEASWNAMRYLNSRGIRPVIALMGPVPEWMLADKSTPPVHKVCNSDSRIAPLAPAMYGEFAEEVVSMAMYARFQAHVGFEYFSPFNETDCYPAEGPRIDPAEAPLVLGAVARRLKKEGLGDVRLTVADNAVITNDYVTPILNDAELMKQVGAFALHTYGENSVGPHVERVKASPYAHVPVWLTEYGDLNDQDKTAENDWTRLSLAANRRALTALNQGASALFYFDAFDDYEECARRLTFYGLFTSAAHLYTDGAITWDSWQGGSYISTPVVYGDYLYLGNTNGVVRCFASKAGKKIYEERLSRDASIYPSLVAAAGKTFCTSEDGDVYVLKAWPEFQIISRNRMGAPCYATPAI